MSSRWDKLVKGATKPKHSPPKAKYIDPIIDATFDEQQSIANISSALSLRLRDPNSTVIFKSLITIHTLLRAGNVSPVFDHFSSVRPLPLDSVVSGHDSPHNLTKYALYLDRRIKTFSSLKYDIMRDRQSDVSDPSKGTFRLRNLSVDGGLLRETSHLQKILDSLVDCKLYLDDVDDDVTLTGLRLLVKDLLTLFQAVNEAVVNILEHYFEMAKTDAEQACKIYRRFCAQTEKVVAYLAVARKLENIIRVSIPNLKHAPVSLARSLEEYLNDPNFERNRLEYKENKRIADGGTPRNPTPKRASPPPAATSASMSTPRPDPSSSGSRPTEAKPDAVPKPAAGDGNKAFIDFFESIEKEQQSMFPKENTQTQNTAPQFQQQHQQQPFSPFGAQQYPQQMQQQPGMAFGGMQSQITGFPGSSPGGGSMQPQPTGFNPFMQPQPTGMSPFSQQSFSGGMAGVIGQPQTGSLGPQTTGANPFRQSMLAMPTGAASGGAGENIPFASPAAPNSQLHNVSSSTGSDFPSNSVHTPSSSSPFFQASQAPHSNSQSIGSGPPLSQSPKPMAAQATGSLNPFAPPPGTVPRFQTASQPSMNQLASGFSQGQPTSSSASGTSSALTSFPGPVAAQPQKQTTGVPVSSPWSAGPHANGGLASNPTGGIMSNVASSFATGNNMRSNSQDILQGNNTSSQQHVSSPSRSNTMPFLSTSSTSSPPIADGSSAPLTAQHQQTGIAGSGIAPFKPTSSFGASLAEKFSTSPAPSAGDPSAASLPTSSAGTFAPAVTGGGISSGPTASSAALQNQPTGNPFGASNFGSKPPNFNTPFGTSLSSQASNLNTGSSPFSSDLNAMHSGVPTSNASPWNVGAATSTAGVGAFSGNNPTAFQPTQFNQSGFSQPSSGPSPQTQQSTSLI